MPLRIKVKGVFEQRVTRRHLRTRHHHHGPSQASRNRLEDVEHNVWNLLLGVLVHHECSPWLHRGCWDAEWCKVAWSRHVVLDLLTVGNVQVARVRRWS